MFEFNPYSLPAVFALLAKIAIFVYAQKTSTTTRQTQQFLVFLFSLALLNCAEIWSYHEMAATDPAFLASGLIYFCTATTSVALFLHFALIQTRQRSIGWITKTVIYAPMVVIVAMLVFSKSIVVGFLPHEFTYTRVPGPLYGLFAVYAGGCCLIALTLLARSAFGPDCVRRTANRWIFLGATPMVVAPIVVLGLQAIGINTFTLPVYFPIFVTVFLIASAYATHEHRIFDIDFFIPGSKVRNRSTAFHRNIQSIIANLDALTDIDKALGIVSKILSCPVAMISDNRSTTAGGPLARKMVDFPRGLLEREQDFLVSREIEEDDADLSHTMNSYGVSAIVRFDSLKTGSDGWLLVGDEIGNDIRSPSDVRALESLFQQLENVVRDSQASEIAQLTAERDVLQAELLSKSTAIDELKETVSELSAQVLELVSAARQSVELSNPEFYKNVAAEITGPIVTYVGRDKTIANELKNRFGIVHTFVSDTAKKFPLRQPENFLVTHSHIATKVLDSLRKRGSPVSLIVFGPAFDYEADDLIDISFVDKNQVNGKLEAMANGHKRYTFEEVLDRTEENLLREILVRCNGVQSLAAKSAGLRDNTIHYKLSRHGLSKPKPRPRNSKKENKTLH